MKKQAFEQWMACPLICNSDQAKCGSLSSGLASQFSMSHDQHPTLVAAAMDVLSHHKHDNCESKWCKKKENTRKEDNVVLMIANSETSFAQSSKDEICCCCRERGHASLDCLKRDTILRSKWAIQKAEQHMQADQG